MGRRAAAAIALALAAPPALAAPDWAGRVALDGQVARVRVVGGRTACRGWCPPDLRVRLDGALVVVEAGPLRCVAQAAGASLADCSGQVVLFVDGR